MRRDNPFPDSGSIPGLIITCGRDEAIYCSNRARDVFLRADLEEDKAAFINFASRFHFQCRFNTRDDTIMYHALREIGAMNIM